MSVQSAPRRLLSPALATGIFVLVAYVLAKFLAGPTAALLAGLVADVELETAPFYLLGLSLAVVGLWLRPFVGLLILATALPVENVFVGYGGTSAIKLLGLLLFIIWFLRKLYRGESWRDLISTPSTIAVSLFVAWVFASAGWAESSSAAVRGAIQLGLLFGLGLVVADLVRSWERAELLARALVLGGGYAAFLTVQQALQGAKRAGDEIAGGANATAAMLVALLPFAFYLLRASQKKLWRFVGLVYLPLSLAAIPSTYSRMALLLLPPVLAVLTWQTIRGRRGRALLLGSALISMIALSGFVPWGRIGSRLTTIPRYVTSVIQPEQESLSVYSGRGYHMQIALAIARDHPIIGGGYDSYGQLFLNEYQFVVRGAPTFVGTKRSPHSSWLGILADLGAVGVVLWSAVLGTAMVYLFRSWRLTREYPMLPSHALVQSTLLCLALYTIPFGFYFQTQREKLLWVVMGLALALHRLSESGNGFGRRAASGPG